MPKRFEVLVELLPNTASLYYPHRIPNDDKTLRRWRINFQAEVNCWLANAKEGSEREFRGINKIFRIRAKLRKVHANPECRLVQFSEPTRSSDTQLFFEEPLTAEDTAKSQIGQKIRDKFEKRQCGDPSPDYLRILVVDLRLMDAAWPDWFCQPSIVERMDETVRILSEGAGPTAPFDVVIPATLDFDCCFGKAVVLDRGREPEITALINTARLDKQCLPDKAEPPPPELAAALKSLSAQGRLT